MTSSSRRKRALGTLAAFCLLQGSPIDAQAGNPDASSLLRLELPPEHLEAGKSLFQAARRSFEDHQHSLRHIEKMVLPRKGPLGGTFFEKYRLQKCAIRPVIDRHEEAAESRELPFEGYEFACYRISVKSNSGLTSVRSPGITFLPPLPGLFAIDLSNLAPNQDFKKLDSSLGLELGWAPVSSTFEGERFVDYLERLRRSETLFDCVDDICKIVQSTFTQASLEEHLSLCRVLVVKETPGAPYDCTPVVLLDTERVWLQVVTGIGNWRRQVFEIPNIERDYGHGARDFDLLIEGDVYPETESILKLIESKFSSEPLQYVTSRTGTYVQAVARYKPSFIFDTYREIATVRVEIVTLEEAEGKYIKLTVSTALLLSKLNTGNAKDYRGATEGETARYVDGVRSLLYDAIGKYCTGSSECREISLFFDEYSGVFSRYALSSQTTPAKGRRTRESKQRITNRSRRTRAEGIRDSSSSRDSDVVTDGALLWARSAELNRSATCRALKQR